MKLQLYLTRYILRKLQLDIYTQKMPLKLLNTINTGFDLLPKHDNTCFRTCFWSEKEVTK